MPTGDSRQTSTVMRYVNRTTIVQGAPTILHLYRTREHRQICLPIGPFSRARFAPPRQVGIAQGCISPRAFVGQVSSKRTRKQLRSGKAGCSKHPLVNAIDSLRICDTDRPLPFSTSLGLACPQLDTIVWATGVICTRPLQGTGTIITCGY
jgi:hypothetical protein